MRLLQTVRQLLGRGSGDGHAPRLRRQRDAPIDTLAPSARVRVPLVQMVATVGVGATVEAGMLVAQSAAGEGRQLRRHSPYAGHVVRADADALVIEGTPVSPGGVTHRRPSSVGPVEIVAAARSAGLVGMGGGEFPTWLKLDARAPVDHVLVNACESEPHNTSDHRVLTEHLDEVACGMRWAMRALGAGRGEIIRATSDYLDGYEPVMIQRHLGRAIPPGGLPRDVGVVVINVQTARALCQAVCADRPLLQRVITVDGGAVGRPGNYLVALGTPIEHVARQCDVHVEETTALIVGGPMMGSPVQLLDSVRAGTTALLALTAEEVARTRDSPCLRCGQCQDACPHDLPVGWLWRSAPPEVLRCVECGACQVACPSGRPLVSLMRAAKARQRLGEGQP